MELVFVYTKLKENVKNRDILKLKGNIYKKAFGKLMYVVEICVLLTKNLNRISYN